MPFWAMLWAIPFTVLNGGLMWPIKWGSLAGWRLYSGCNNQIISVLSCMQLGQVSPMLIYFVEIHWFTANKSKAHEQYAWVAHILSFPLASYVSFMRREFSSNIFCVVSTVCTSFSCVPRLASVYAENFMHTLSFARYFEHHSSLSLGLFHTIPLDIVSPFLQISLLWCATKC